ncbi:hypothetical protein HNR31_003410 [Anoxybacillus caldiproteolyticus]|uniref:Uncharacterized protein n=1 Tax=Thermaerobacillus caldiproteolyticus TaxID=247480 RepID=A0A7V9Z9L7_9BACL|nr:hypothetical protein [Anoxybacillus caldiproteolyticus]
MRHRKENDISRKRGNFEKHLGIAASHQRYYESLNNIVPNYVQLIEAESVDNNVEAIMENISYRSDWKTPYSLNLFDGIVEWLTNNKA